MADISGPGGSITSITGFNCHFSGWAATLTPSVVDNTGFSENGNRTSLVTAQQLIGSAVGTVESNNAPAPAGIFSATPSMSSYTGIVTLQFAAGHTWTFNANATSVAINRPNDGKADYAISFVSNGSISQSSWA